MPPTLVITLTLAWIILASMSAANRIPKSATAHTRDRTARRWAHVHATVYAGLLALNTTVRALAHGPLGVGEFLLITAATIITGLIFLHVFITAVHAWLSHWQRDHPAP